MRKGLIFVVVMIAFISCSKEVTQQVEFGEALGTTYQIIYFDTAKNEQFSAQIDSVFAAVNQSMSTYIPTSDISKLNAGDSSIRVDAMFQEVFLQSKDIYEATGGAFDPTVGSLVNAWGFGPETAIEMDSMAVDSIMRYVGFNKVSLQANQTIKKEHPSIYFDFNAIAKGYSLDRIALVLDRLGYSNYLIEVGGELVAKGQHVVKKKPFLVGVDDPQSDDRSSPVALLQLQDAAMASSGNYRKFKIDATTGVKYVHTINAKTGFTKVSNILAVSVIAPNCAMADGYATAFMAMDLPDTQKLLRTQQTVQAYVIYLDEDGKTQQFFTPGFKALVLD